VLWTKGAPIPRGERVELDPTLRAGPWMFNQPIQQDVTEMVVTSTRKIEEPVSQDEVGRRQYEAGVAEQELVAESTRLAHYFATKYGERTNASTQAAVSVQTARKWLKRGFTFAELRAHVDRVIAEVPTDERLPARLSDYLTIASRNDEVGIQRSQNTRAARAHQAARCLRHSRPQSRRQVRRAAHGLVWAADVCGSEPRSREAMGPGSRLRPAAAHIERLLRERLASKRGAPATLHGYEAPTS
jgi:hypothetical protein